ncbi:MAG: carboxypeptidase-like regulatory domain-containing protein, partial [Bacteroidota bacterium]
MNKYFICSLLLIIMMGAWTPTQAQDSLRVQGQLLSASSEQPLAFVTLLIKQDSTTLTGGISAEDGSFALQVSKQEALYLVIRHLGYEEQKIELATGPDNLIDVGTIKLVNTEFTVETVEIEGQKSMFSLGADGTIIFNVANTTLSGLGSAVELMERTPGVVLDINGELVLNGQRGVLVKIDGRDLRMSGTELQNYLRSLNSQDVESIEIIQNPSASYDAEGSAGIIHIKTKKSREKGFGGRANLSANYGQNLRYRGGINTNWRISPKVNFSARANLSQGKSAGDLDEQRYIRSTQERLIRENERLYSYANQTLNFGLDINASPQHFVGLVVDVYNENDNDLTESQTNIFQQEALNSRVDFTSDGNLTWTNLNATLTHNWSIDTFGSELISVADFGNYDTDSRFDLSSDFYMPDGSLMDDPLLRRTTNPNLLGLWSVKSDFSTERPGFYLEAGYKISHV